MKENRTNNELLKIKSRTRPMKTNESVEVDLMSIVDERAFRRSRRRVVVWHQQQIERVEKFQVS